MIDNGMLVAFEIIKFALFSYYEKKNSLVYTSCPRVSKSRFYAAPVDFAVNDFSGPPRLSCIAGYGREEAARERSFYLDRIRCTKQSFLPLFARNYIYVVDRSR